MVAGGLLFSADEGTRTPTSIKTQDPKSCSATNYDTSAENPCKNIENNYYYKQGKLLTKLEVLSKI